MNVVFLSPHFPPSYYLFCVQLRRFGANVLGIAEEQYGNLRPELKEALTEYYRVDRLEDYDQALRAVAYFTHRYGRIDRIVSHNEHWLELEAYLRESFNVFGKKLAETAEIKHKSLMKKTFTEAGIDTAPGRVVRSLPEARPFVGEVGYPVIAKPDKGVGAIGTYKLGNDDELENFFRTKPDVDYFVEPFVEGRVVTFDGLADRDGTVVYYMSLQYSDNIMEVVAAGEHLYYYTLRDIPQDLVEAGMASVRAFRLKEQFFHFEFFRTPQGRLLALEINARPPGWPTTDIFNYANDGDIYRTWASVVVENVAPESPTRKYHCMFIGRKDRIRYRHRHEDVLERYGACVAQSMRMPGVFAQAMGDHAYIARSPRLEELKAMAAFVHEKA